MQIQHKDDLTTIILTDRLDATNSTDISKKISDNFDSINNELLFDVSNLDYISSAGLQVVLMCAKHMKSKNKKVYLFGANENILEIFQISGFLTFITKIDSIDEI